MAADEYRVEVDLDDEAHGHPFSERLAALDLDDDVAAKLGDRVIVTRDGPKMFVYTQSREAAEEAGRVVEETLLEDGLYGAVRLTRWDSGATAWVPFDAPASAAPEPAEAAEEAPDDGKLPQHPLFTYVEAHEPQFLRDLGV